MDPPPADKVDKTVHDQVKADLFKTKEKLRKFEEEKQAAADAQMKANNQFKELLEAREAELTELKTKDKVKDKVIADTLKYSAVQEMAVKAGIRKEALKDLDLVALEDVQIETTSTGRMNVLGADKFVDRLKASRPHWFGAAGAPRINGGLPGAGEGGKITARDLLTAGEAAKKSGDNSAYQEMYKRYQSQGR